MNRSIRIILIAISCLTGLNSGQAIGFAWLTNTIRSMVIDPISYHRGAEFLVRYSLATVASLAAIGIAKFSINKIQEHGGAPLTPKQMLMSLGVAGLGIFSAYCALKSICTFSGIEERQAEETANLQNRLIQAEIEQRQLENRVEELVEEVELLSGENNLALQNYFALQQQNANVQHNNHVPAQLPANFEPQVMEQDCLIKELQDELRKLRDAKDKKTQQSSSSSSNASSKAEASNDVCACCHEQIIKNTNLSCGHTFHADCIANWMTSGQPNALRCPCCRGSIQIK